MAAKPTSSSSAVTPSLNTQKLLPQKQQRPIEQQQEKRIEEVLSFPILLSDQINKSVKESESFKFECSEVGKHVDRLCQMLRTAVRLATSTSAGAAFYDRPLRRIAAEVSRNLEKSLTLVKKCRRRSILRRVVTIVSAADFRKLLAILDSSVADMKWCLTIFDAAGGIVLTLPPIASNDPIISWVWSFIASLHMGQLQDRIEAANELSSLAKDNDRNKQIIVDEGGIPPLLKLLKDVSSTEAQIAASSALFNLVNDQDRVQTLIDELGIPIIVQVLGSSIMKVQITVANLVAKMAEYSPLAKEDFARDNVIRPLVTLISFDLFVDDPKIKPEKQSIHSLVQINKELEKKSLFKSGSGSSNLSIHYAEGSCKGLSHRKEREYEKPELKLELKISCAKALWMLAKSSVPNSKRITDTKGLLCLAKLVEAEEGELQRYCLMTIMEITAAAESNADLRRATFKTNSPPAKAVVDQLLRVIKEYSEDDRLQMAAAAAIGNLARTFPARETRVVIPLVELLSHRNQEVAIEAAIALTKFACSENFLCVEHCKSIIEFGGVPKLMRLLKGGGRGQINGLILTCYLAIHAGKSDDLEKADVLSAFEGLDRAFVAQHSDLRELVPQAIYHLSVFHQSHSGMLVQRPF